MGTLVITLHVIVAIALILSVLLQTGKGANVGAAFGGGSSGTVFGSRGPASFMSKLTAAAAIIFMLTSLGLNVLNNQQIIGDSVMEDVSAPGQEAPLEPAESTVPGSESASEAAPEAPIVPKDQAQPITPAPADGNQ